MTPKISLVSLDQPDIHVCVCVCVCERARERERHRESAGEQCQSNEKESMDEHGGSSGAVLASDDRRSGLRRER